MLANLVIFFICLAVLGFLVIRRVMLMTNTNISSHTTSRPWYKINMMQFQGQVWHFLLTSLRWVLVITVVQLLLLIERAARFLARTSHKIIEDTLHYRHDHRDETQD